MNSEYVNKYRIDNQKDMCCIHLQLLNTVKPLIRSADITEIFPFLVRR